MLIGTGTLEELWVLLQMKMKAVGFSLEPMLVTPQRSEWIFVLTLRLCKRLSLRERGEFI